MTPFVTAAIQSNIDRDVRAQLRNAHVPGATVAVVKDGDVIYVRGYGERDSQNRAPADDRTHYEIGSITKQFTAAAILQLKEAGKIDLDATVATYLPSVPHAKEVTIRELLTHTSGLHEYMDGADSLIGTPATFDQLMVRVADKPLDFEPGTNWAYSNTNYIVLGRIVEVVSHQSWDAYVKTHLFVPAGMSDSSTIAGESAIVDMAQGYALVDGRALPSKPLNESWASGAGAIVSTVGDLAKWGDALASGRIVSRADYQLLTTSGQLVDGQTTGYGFGMALDTFEGQRRIWHNGNTFGFDASDQYFPDQRVRIIVLTNDADGNSDQIAGDVFNDLFPKIAAQNRDWGVDNAKAHQLYVQAIRAMSDLPQPVYVTYRLLGENDGMQVGLIMQDGNLWLNMGGGHAPSDWSVEHRTYDYKSIVTDDSTENRYATARSFFDPTWYGTERALRLGMLYSQDPAAPHDTKAEPTPPPGPTLRTIAVTSVMSPSIYNIEDRGPARCANGNAGRALHVWSREHNGMHQLSDVTIDLSSMRFCMMRYSLADSFGFHGVVEQHFANVDGYWMQTDGLLDGTLRFLGFATHHGIWRYRLTDMRFPEHLSI